MSSAELSNVRISFDADTRMLAFKSKAELFYHPLVPLAPLSGYRIRLETESKDQTLVVVYTDLNNDRQAVMQFYRANSDTPSVHWAGAFDESTDLRVEQVRVTEFSPVEGNVFDELLRSKIAA